MKRKLTITKQLIVFCLLIVFSSIQIAKAVHTHGQSTYGHVDSNITHVEKTSDCAICDYHFSKDTDFYIPILTLQKPLIAPVIIFSYQSRTTSSIGLSYSDRGPPAL